jgi:bla regulator protein BlaR1
MHKQKNQSTTQKFITMPLLVAFCLCGTVAARTDAGGTNTQLSKYGKNGNAYVFFSGGDVTSLNASGTDLDQAQAFRGKTEGELLWARQGGKTWAVSDANLIGEVHKILDPTTDISTRQGTAGSKQGDLGGQQAELGDRQAEVERQKAAVKAEISKQAASGQNTDDLKKQLRSLEEKKKELGKQQAELGQQQSGLGKQQAEMGKQQAKIAERNYMKLGTLVDQAIRNGLAGQIKP